jgi:predicted glycoside hydrolase/deacetylase ChbG (UPF0249 family)
VRRLIINADDFGLTRGVNNAIVEANQNGVVTSATLMANSNAFADAAAQAKQETSTPFSVGCHLVLVDGQPVLPPVRVPSLTKSTNDFRRGVGELALAARQGKLDPSELENEAVAQFRKLWESGIRPSHFDTHKHAHLFPEILAPALRAACACGIVAVRNPFEPRNSISFSLLAKYRSLIKRYVQVQLLRTTRSRWMQQVRKSGLKTPDGSFGIITTGDNDATLFRALLENMPEGTWELVCHPGYNDADLDKVHTRLRASRVKELELLTSPETRQLIQSLDIELISYRQL